jgi:dihydropteroate synthase
VRFSYKDQTIDLSCRALVMGILNVTPDSFSDGGRHAAVDTALAGALQMLQDGADIIDIGGESTRPGSAEISVEQELERVVPVICELRKSAPAAIISIDTSKGAVARAAMNAGADIINDISGFHRDPGMAEVAAKTNAGCVAMHMRGIPATMQQFTEYDDLIGEINHFFEETIQMLADAGVRHDRICLDPGIGFSKTVEQNLELIDRLDAFLVHDCPVLLGPSRKSFIGKTLGIEDPGERVWGTAAAVSAGILRGARILRVHDVKEMRQVTDLAMAIARFAG